MNLVQASIVWHWTPSIARREPYGIIVWLCWLRQAEQGLCTRPVGCQVHLHCTLYILCLGFSCVHHRQESVKSVSTAVKQSSVRTSHSSSDEPKRSAMRDLAPSSCPLSSASSSSSRPRSCKRSCTQHIVLRLRSL